MSVMCYNYMTLTGPRADLARFCELFRMSNYEFTYEAFIPTPLDLEIPLLHEDVYTRCIFFYLRMNAKEYGKPPKGVDTETIQKWDKDNEYGLLDGSGQWSKNAWDYIDAWFRSFGPYRNNPFDLTYEDCECPKKDCGMLYLYEEMYALGERLISNKATYGYYNWAEFHEAKWGDKWNANTSMPIELKKDKVTFTFISGRNVPNILKAIMKEFPSLTLLDEIQSDGYPPEGYKGENGVLRHFESKLCWD